MKELKTMHGKRSGSGDGPGAEKKQKPGKVPAAAGPAAIAVGGNGKGTAGDAPGYPYVTEYGDHFETSDAAVAHIEPLLYRCDCVGSPAPTGPA